MATVVTPIDRYLAEQREGTAVERFARRHEADLLEPEHRWYADRLPLAAPGDGEQYAFRVDLDRCTGCKACVAACHSLNGLDEGESWRSVGQLVGVDQAEPRQQHVPTGCHHCLEPACLSGCPTNAYEKDPVTGIVRHLDDQCIGCSYCELTCPYEVPRLNRRLGIVRKCDLCADRLAEGEAPACVQACPTSAITVAVVDTHEVAAGTRAGGLVPGAPPSSHTGPTTQYVGGWGVLTDGAAVAADHHAVQPSRAHPPLALMLVLTQLSVGALVGTVAAEHLAGTIPPGAPLGAALAGVVALAASVLHLGRPTVAWRAVLGVGHSWLSREIVLLGAYAAASAGYGVASATGVSPWLTTAAGLGAALAGVAGVASSAMVYVATHRPSWRAAVTFPRFAASAALTGPLFLAAVVLGTAAPGDLDPGTLPLVRVALVVAGAVAVAKLAAEVAGPRRRIAPGSDADRRARLLTGRLRTQRRWRLALGAVGGIAGPVAVLGAVGVSTWGAALLAVASLLCATAGELVERHHFFVASGGPRMPGGFRR